MGARAWPMSVRDQLRNPGVQPAEPMQTDAWCHYRTHAPQHSAGLFDDVIRKGQQRGGDVEAKGLCGLEINYKLKSGGLFHR